MEKLLYAGGVAIGYTGERSFKLLKKKNDENGYFLISESMIDDCVVILINLYNPHNKNSRLLHEKN